MTDVAASVEVRVPVRTAYHQWTQFESFPIFMAGVVAVQQLGERATHWVTEIGGAHREFDAEVVEQHPDERIAWQSTDGDLRHSGVVTFESLSEDETRVTVDLAWEPRGALEKLGSVLGVDQMEVKADLERFKEFIEARDVESGEWRGRTSADGSASHASAEPHPAALPDAYDVVDVLCAQHLQLRRMFAQTAEAFGDARARHLAELLLLLELHEKGEQQVVHPVLRSTGAEGSRTAENRLAEEREAYELVTALKHLEPGSPEFDEQFARLRDAVLEHAGHEETEEFPQLRQELPPEQRRAMAEELLLLQNGQD